MKQLPDYQNDEQLVTFLSQYRPVPPPAADNLETKLMQMVQQQPRPKKLAFSPLWVIPSAVAAGILLLWGGYTILRPSSQFAETNERELEVFLVNGWNGTMKTTMLSYANTPEADWYLLTNPEAETTVVNY